MQFVLFQTFAEVVIHKSPRRFRCVSPSVGNSHSQRWTNLWWEVDVVSSSASEDADVVSASGLKEHGRGPPPSGDEMGTSSVSGQCEDAAESIGLLVGTITLFSAILLGIFLVHLVGISVIQAYWVAKVRCSLSRLKRVFARAPLGQVSTRGQCSSRLDRSIDDPKRT